MDALTRFERKVGGTRVELGGGLKGLRFVRVDGREVLVTTDHYTEGDFAIGLYEADGTPVEDVTVVASESEAVALVSEKVAR